jgi:hypothetical protein
MSLSNYAENLLANWIRGNANMPNAATPYLALFSDNPGDNNTGTEVTTDIRASGRLAISFGAPTNGVIANNTEIDFGESENDVSISHFGIYDAQSGGNLIAHGALASQRSILTSDRVEWNAGALVVTID